MKRITAIVEMASEASYSCYVPEPMGNCLLVGYGDTPQEAMDDLQASFEEMREMEAKAGRSVPDVEFEYKYDM